MLQKLCDTCEKKLSDKTATYFSASYALPSGKAFDIGGHLCAKYKKEVIVFLEKIMIGITSQVRQPNTVSVRNPAGGLRGQKGEG